MKTFSKVMSLIVMRWCGSTSQYGMCTVCCAQHSTAQDEPGGCQSKFGPMSEIPEALSSAVNGQ